MQVISLSHENASLAYREALQLSAPEADLFMLSLKQRDLVTGLVVVTTCNRTEVYFESEGTPTTLIQEELLSFKKIENRAIYQKLFKNIRQSQDTFQYLLEVGIGLRSQVLGDRQIISQLKASYQQAHALQVTSPLLHRGFNPCSRPTNGCITRLLSGWEHLRWATPRWSGSLISSRAKHLPRRNC
nr:hypothetical protein [Rufibacter sp. SYSU D00308]